MSNELLIFITIFSRFFGFFVLSPLFSKQGIPHWVGAILALSCSLLLFPPLSTQIHIVIENPSLLSLQIVQEIFLGYLIGFLFAIIFEAAALAGQIVGSLTGFSAVELLHPLYNTPYPLMAKFFSISIFTLFLSMDFHHLLLHILYGSFFTTPIATQSILESSSQIFQQAISYAFVPLTFLSMLIIFFAAIARFLPNLQIFWIGFPLQIIIGLLSIALAFKFFSSILQDNIYTMLTSLRKIFFSL